MNKQLILKVSNEIEIMGSNKMPQPLVEELLNVLIMENPKYKSALDHGYSTHRIPSTLHFIKKNYKGNWLLPRGFYFKLQDMIKRHDIPYRILDKCKTREEVDFNFIGELRGDQPDAASAILSNQYSVLQRPTGGGKTVIALYVIAKRRQSTLITVHTKELMDQWVERAEEFLGIKEKEIGLIGGGHKTLGSKKLIISIINSLYKNIDMVKDVVGQIFIDECFIAGTSVDGNPIEKIKVGDFVNSYNHKLNKIEKKKVLRVFKSKPSSLCSVKIKNHNIITCTEGHPFYVKRKKYFTSQELNISMDSMLSIDYHLLKLRRIKDAKNSNDKMLRLWKKSKMPREQTLENLTIKSKYRNSVLFGQMHQSKAKKWQRKICKVFKWVQQKIRLRKNEKIKPNVQEKKYRKNEINKTSKRNLKYMERKAWWEWAIHSTSNIIINCFGLGNRINNKNRELPTGWEWIPNLLQSRYRKQRIENSNRNRWKTTQGKKTKIKRPEKRKETYWSRLEDIKIHKRRGDGTFGKLCPENYVYNIEVEVNNNYFANGVLVHNCHRVPSRTFSDAVSKFDCRFFVGLSATPYRKDGLTKVINFYLGDVVYKTDIKDLQKKKQVMKASLVVIKTNFNYFMKGTKNYAKMYKGLVEDQKRNELIIETVVKNNKKSSKQVSLIISDRKDHCRMFYERLQEMDLRVGMLIGGTHKEDRKEIKERLNDGCYDIFISTSQLIGEGFDCPRLAFLYLTTPISDAKRLTQYIGRVIRILEGKKDAIVFDFFDPQWLLQISFRKRINTYVELGVRPKDMPEGMVWPKDAPKHMSAGSPWSRQISEYIDWLGKQ
jgi:superfamily II DNA or RNA helicase